MVLLKLMISLVWRHIHMSIPSCRRKNILDEARRTGFISRGYSIQLTELLTLTFRVLQVLQPPLDFLCGRFVMKSPGILADKRMRRCSKRTWSWQVSCGYRLIVRHNTAVDCFQACKKCQELVWSWMPSFQAYVRPWSLRSICVNTTLVTHSFKWHAKIMSLQMLHCPVVMSKVPNQYSSKN